MLLSFDRLLLVASFCMNLVDAKYKEKRAVSTDKELVPQFVELPLDHFSKNPGTFKNRYFVNDAFYKTGGPVFLLDGGEGSVNSSVGWIYTSADSGGITDLAKQFNGLLIAWEHRYYGQSYPPNQPTNITEPDDVAKYYSYLTAEQALEDVAVFAKNFSLASQAEKDLRPSAVPWVMIGASYPGVRAAWMRLRNPEVVFASLSSSAPVELQIDFWQYFYAYEQALNDYGYKGCLNDLHAFANWLTDVVAKKDVAVIEAFLYNSTVSYEGVKASTTQSWQDRIDSLGSIYTNTILGDFQGQGLKGGAAKVCNALKSRQYTNDAKATATNLKDGIVAYYGLNYSVAVLSSVLYDRQINATKEEEGNHTKTEEEQAESDADSLTWFYQTCTEMGFFQGSNITRSTNVVPGFDTVASSIRGCVKSFGSTVKNGPNPTALLKKYSGWSMNPTNVLSTNGQYDPWRALSVSSDFSPSFPARNLTTTIPKANTPPPNNQIFGMIIANGSHANDFDFNSTDSSDKGTAHRMDVNAAHGLLIAALSSWLPAYTTYTPTSTTKATAVPTTLPSVTGWTDAEATETAKTSKGYHDSAKMGGIIAGFLGSAVLMS
ncbi:serine carboxypeptidase S28-domain-containing protein [Tricladium varicosporioides]|nr:serine carboxypeptidase S28-domain-containing protein [Hymenoscyphus varicosporioides]